MTESYSIVKIGVRGNISATGWKHCTYDDCVDGLIDLYQDCVGDAPLDKKDKCRRVDLENIIVYDCGAQIQYKIQQD